MTCLKFGDANAFFVLFCFSLKVNGAHKLLGFPYSKYLILCSELENHTELEQLEVE